MMTEIHGFVGPGLEPVRDAFAANFENGLECGASVAVTLNGEPVIDLWAGDTAPGGNPWQQSTLVNVYSTTKTMAAMCMLMLADRGEIDFAAPVARYWPEFAHNGKAAITVSHVMSHSAGLPGFEPPLENVELLYDWQAICERLAAMEPWWQAGTQSGYHAITQGYLQGEILRRVDGRSLGQFFREEIATPLGADFHIGLPASEDDRVAELIPPDGPPPGLVDLDPESIAVRASRGAALTGKEPHTRAWRAAEIPAAGGIGNARSIARIHSALACEGSVDDVRLLSAAGVARAMEEQVRGVDMVLGVPMVFGNGFGISDPIFPVSPNPRCFFWGGWGGSLSLIDLDARLSFAYTMNKMDADLMGDVRGIGLVGAVYAALEPRS
jgi:CubicO group peptidase (beta-lactamase class C family)